MGQMGRAVSPRKMEGPSVHSQYIGSSARAEWPICEIDCESQILSFFNELSFFLRLTKCLICFEYVDLWPKIKLLMNYDRSSKKFNNRTDTTVLIALNLDSRSHSSLVTI